MRKKSRKVVAASKRKAFIPKEKLKGTIPLDANDSESDVDSESFYHDEIDDYHKEQDDQLSTDDELNQDQVSSSEEEEILPVSGGEDDDDEDDYGGDEEDEASEENADDDLPNLDAWGKKKSVYYNADFVDEDRGRTYREEDAEAARAEAEEALAIQRSVLSQVNAQKLGADFLLEDSSGSSEDEEQDLAHATVQEKIKYLKNSNPEMFDYIEDFQKNCNEVRERILPLLHLASKGKLPSESCAYVKLKYQLLLHCNLNITIYMMLHDRCSLGSNHPVIQRIASYKKLLEKLKPIDDAVKKDVDSILQRLQDDDDDISFDVPEVYKPIKPRVKRPLAVTVMPPEKKMKKAESRMGETEAEKEILSFINQVKEERKKVEEKMLGDMKVSEDNESSEEENEVEPEDKVLQRRNITSEIAKNKGLTPRRKKEYRNPRVHNRIKYKKAKIRRKGQVRDVVKEVKRYEGEPTGISANVIRSVKLK